MKRIAFNFTSLLLMLCHSMAAYTEENAVLDNPNLHPAIPATVPAWCNQLEWCGNMVAVDCHSSTDGPLYYFNNDSGELLMICGGRCMNPNPSDPKDCAECPPEVWKNCLTE